jgi:dephospho-CoA kinase
MISVGLTGGIGSGKSTVSAALLSRGAVLVDADAITKSLQQPGMPVFNAMVERFGPQIVGDDGQLDRPAVAAIVFSDPDALADLNAIVHPLVGTAIAEAIAAAADDDIVILDIPLLAEGRRPDGSLRYDVAGIIVVDCPVDVQVERLKAHRGFDEEDARARIANQASRETRLEMADLVIDNSGSLDDLEPQIEAAWQWLQQLLSSPAPQDRPTEETT